jgi:hypothetical protein
VYYRPGPVDTWQTGTNPLTLAAVRAMMISSSKGKQMFYVAQFQPHINEVEILWTCNSEEQAQSEVDRMNSNLADAGIPSTYYAFIL